MRNISAYMLLIFCLFYSCSNHDTIKLKSPFDKKLWEKNGNENNSTETILPAVKDSILRITNINQPSMRVFPAKGVGIKPAVIIFPGGGYSILAYDLEGTEIAHWLNDIGITAIVVKYTVPNNRESAFKDGKRAIHLVQKNAYEWDIDPNRIGVMGFSAGGHLSARLSTDFIVRKGNSLQNLNHKHTRPDFSILIYPAYLDDNNSKTLASEIRIFESIPPTLMVQTKDDSNFVNGTILYNKALQESNMDVTFHLFDIGGHGYGLRANPQREVSEWPKRVEEWFFDKGIIDSLTNYK